MNIENWITVIGIIVTGGVGYGIRYFFDKKAQFSSENAQVKRKMYQDYVDLIIDFFDSSTANKPAHKVQKEMYNFYKKCVLYASPKVINAYSSLMQHFYNTTHDEGGIDIVKTRTSLKKMTKVFKYMRKDIGLSNSGLGRDGELLFRAIITDYDEKIKPRKYEVRPNSYVGGISSNTTKANEDAVKIDNPAKNKNKLKKKGRR